MEIPGAAQDGAGMEAQRSPPLLETLGEHLPKAPLEIGTELGGN